MNGKTNLERLTGVEGKDLELECSVLGGQPVPEVWWLYQNEILNHSVTGSVLFTIKSVTRAMDLKVIYCMVANEALVQPIKIQLQILLTCKFVQVYIYVFEMQLLMRHTINIILWVSLEFCQNRFMSIKMY